MRYMLIHAADPDLASEWDGEAQTSLSSWIEETVRSRVNLQGSRLRPTADATTIKIRDAELMITDGPYVETKEQIAGYDVLECASLDEAVRWAGLAPQLLGGGDRGARPAGQRSGRAPARAG